MNSKDYALNQGIGSYVNMVNILRLEDMATKLNIILSEQEDLVSDFLLKQNKALNHINAAELDINIFINSNRGGDTGLHGFIAEAAEVGVSNARRALDGVRKIATHIDDNGPADLKVGQSLTQMKFYQNLTDELKQSENYRTMKMMFSKDHLEVYRKIMNNERYVELNGKQLTNRTMDSIRKIIETESKARGVSHREWMQSSKLNYSEVQKNTIEKTLSKEKNEIKSTTDSRINNSNKELERKKEVLRQKAAPSLDEGIKAGMQAGLVQGGLNFAGYAYTKNKEGLKIWEYSEKEWKEAEITSVKGATKGAVTGFSIYSLTNFVGLNAPAASSLVSATGGIASAAVRFRSREIDAEEFMSLVMLSTIDSTAAAFGAAIGGTLIPVPVIGSVIGSLIATSAVNIGVGILNKKELEIIKRYQDNIEQYVQQLDKEYQEIYNELIKKFKEIDDIQNYLLSVNVNSELQFVASIKLAEVLEVDHKEILHSLDDIDNYFFN